MLGIEHLEERARVLAAAHTPARATRGRGYDPLGRLRRNARVLSAAYQSLVVAVRRGEGVPPAAEWLLDNHHVIESGISDVARNLPRRYSRQLPRLASPEMAGLTRIHAMALEFVRSSDARVDLPRMTRFLKAYQTVAPLTLGELWAWPSMLKLCLIEHIRCLADEIVSARRGEAAAGRLYARFESAGDRPLPALPADPSDAFVVELAHRLREMAPRAGELRVALEQRLAASGRSIEEAVRAEHHRQTSAHASIGNSITSLRLVSVLDWNRAVEQVSLIEQVLQRDPAGVYGRMDFPSRDRYRQAVEELAEPSGEAQLRVALRAVEKAREGREHPEDPRCGHVGHHLIGAGRRAFEADVDAAPTFARRLRRPVFAYATAFYLGTLALLTVAGAAAAAWLAGGRGPGSWLAAALALIPASQLAVTVVQRMVAWFAHPRTLPRLDPSAGLTPEARTLVVIPTLLTSVDAARALVERLEVQSLANADAHLHLCLATDFPDSTRREEPTDGEILATAVAGIEDLNARHGPRFHLFHRGRRWNAREGVWMGWERKRGKLEELNRLLRGAEDTSFEVIVGDRGFLPGVRYVLTLDADTRLPRDAARQLVGILEHPLNRPFVDRAARRVVHGYGILQPRVSVTTSSAAGSLFARVYAGHTGVDPYTRAVSDVYQDLFGEGIFTGKGLYDVDAFMAVLAGRVPENALLSHDLFEGIHARTGLVSDVEVVDDFPSNVLAHASRQKRWVRGDWQILLWLFPLVPTRHGVERNRLPLIHRWKILDNLRRSLFAPAMIAWLAAAWSVLPGSPWLWNLAAIAVLGAPVWIPLAQALRGPRPQQPANVFLHDVRRELATAGAQALLETTLLAFQAWQMLDAIGTTLVRLLVTQRRLLEWETAAAAAARFARLTGLRRFAAGMWLGPAVALGIAALLITVRPGALPAALPFLLLWLASPAVAYWLSRPVAERVMAFSAEDRAYLRRVAYRTWRYFELRMGDEDHGLPPDNEQETPVADVAHRTSPTNIGMGLLSVLAAHDFGFIGTPEMIARLDRTLSTLESLERHEGHPLNWYDTRTLAPLLPRYVSTVDSGNLAGALIALAQGLRQLTADPAPAGIIADGLASTTLLLRESLGSIARDRRAFQRRLRHALGQLAALEGEWTDRARRSVHRAAATTALARTAEALAVDGIEPPEDAQAWIRAMTHLLRRLDADLGEAATRQMLDLAARAERYANGIRFGFLFHRERRIFSIGYRLPDADGPGRLDDSYYDLLASEARLASFLAIANRDVPQEHWFQLGRTLTSVAGIPTIVSWSGSMFEYLMPLLLMRNVPNTLLDLACRAAVRAHVDYARRHHVPWGISESAFHVVDRGGHYQYKAFGVPELGLKRGLTEDLVIAPYATALAALVDPGAAVANLRRLERAGMMGRLGFYEAMDYTPRGILDVPGTPRAAGPTAGVPVRAFLAHHQGMTLVAIADVLLDSVMISRFHSDPRVQATELLLQERIPTFVPVTRPRPAEITRVSPVLTLASPRRFRTGDTLYPHAAFLSNGQYVSVVTQAGGGASRCRHLDVTRARTDAVTDPGSQFLYLRDVRTGEVWSPTPQPTGHAADEFRATLFTEKAVFRQRAHEVDSLLEIAVSPEDDVEVRRLALTNRSLRPREIEVTSYVEVALAPHAEDLAHPAFGKLFLETERWPDGAALLCSRRPRAAGDSQEWALHVMSHDGRAQGAIEWETDRTRFLGRGRTVADPVALDGRPLSGATGATLDPILSLRQRIRIAPGGFARVTFVTGFATSRESAAALCRKYADPASASRTLALATTQLTISLRHLGLSVDEAQLYERLASRVFHADRSLLAPEAVIRSNRLGQRDLWRHGISGDLPILLIQVVDPDDLPLVRHALRAQDYWRMKGLAADLVILNEHAVGYRDEMHDQLDSMRTTGPWGAWKDRHGGSFLLRSDGIGAADRTLLLAVARAVLHGDSGELEQQLDLGYPEPEWPAPIARTIRDAGAGAWPQEPGPDPGDRLHVNGRGGFRRDGREYVIVLDGDDETPLPWSNVIANPAFGSVVTAAGPSYTWCGNSRENRLTPFANDPVTEASGEGIWLRDEDSGEAWGATPGAMRRDPRSGRWVVRHGAGVTRWEHVREALHHDLAMFVHADEPLRFARLTLENRGRTTRRLSAFAYHEWALGPPRPGEHLQVATELDRESGAVFARNPYASPFPEQVAFAWAAGAASATGWKLEFVGRNRSLQRPIALERTRLSGRFGVGREACGALQVPVEIIPGERVSLLFLLGQGADADDARARIRRHGTLEAAAAALEAVERAWHERLSAIVVRTPDDSFDLMMNQWLLYPAIASRLWARTGFFQPGGAYGFRDQLQDGMALGVAAPALAREHLLRAAARQFVEGDVQHWWHDHSGAGIRSRCSDDRLWLPLAIARYVDATGDAAVLDQSVGFLEGPPLEPEQAEAYGRPDVSSRSATLYEHGALALDHDSGVGAHGLPKIGSCDWNDGMNRVGREGRGESVWLGWFRARVLQDYARLAERRGDRERAARWRQEVAQLGGRLEQAWDGDWYVRAYFDDGTPLGSAQNEECRIDSIAQSWAVFSGLPPVARLERAMDSVRAHLVRRDGRAVLLLEPPFDRSRLDPGYIRGYVPGVRENGGQYTHAAIWVVMAVAALGNGDEAVELFHLLNPVNHARTREGMERYKVEPYVVAADVYAHPAHVGRGGWTWYTGSSAWMYRAGLESILGVEVHGDRLSLKPCIPAGWPGFSVTLRRGDTRWEIEVENPERRVRGIARVELDGENVRPDAIPLRQDGERHVVKAVMGTPAKAASTTATGAARAPR